MPADGLQPLPAAALARVPGCEAGAAPEELTLLGGGPANASYRIVTRRGAFVVRMHAAQSALLGVDRAREALLHAHAARAGLAPALIASDPGGAFLITEFVPGRVWEASDMGEPAALARLGERLRTLHGLPAPEVAGFDPAALVQRHVARIAAADPADGSALAPWLKRAGAILEACRASGRSACLVHNDLHHANVLCAGSALYLLDWEYAAVTDPLFDLACLLAYYPPAARHASLLLEASGLAAPGAARELADLTWVYVLLSYLWYRALRLNGPAAAAHEDAMDSERALLVRLRTG
jgi:aminoglycoside phosphotransferase (APT) family kinase protein